MGLLRPVQATIFAAGQRGIHSMAVPRPNLGLPFNVVRASHVEFGARDLALASAFSLECLGS